MGRAKDPKSIAGRARAAGLRAATVQYRLNHGWSLRKALTTPVRAATWGVSAKAREAGLSPVTVQRRIARGWSEERALATPAATRKPGMTYATEYSATPGAIASRRHEGKRTSFVSALLGRQVSKREADRVYRDMLLTGVIPPESIKGRVRKAGARVSYATVFYRMKRGWSEEDAISTGRLRRHSGLSQKARDRGLNPRTVRNRRERGMSDEEALSYVRPVTLTQKAREAGLDPATVRLRVARGWPEKRALSTPPLR